MSREFQLPLLHLPSTFFSQQLLKVELSSKSENICKCLKPFRERAGVVREWHFPSSCRAEGREPWVPPGYPQNLGFPRVPGPAFQGFGHLSHPSLRAILGGFRDPQNMVFQAHPGRLELRIMAFPGPFLVSFLGLLRGPS